MKKRVVWFSAVLFLLVSLALLSSISTMAQLPTGTILGTVKDSTGAVVAGAMVSVTDVDTGVSRTGVTEADGSYRFPALPVGNYKVDVSKEGFEVANRTGITLVVEQVAVIDVSLAVGSTSQTVTITAEAPQVDTSTSSAGGIVNEERVADLPLNGRNWTDLALLQAGITKILVYSGNSSGGTGLNGLMFSSNGATVRSNTYLLDGADERSQQGLNTASVSNSTLGVDGIKEFKVVTILPDASYGMSMGAQTTIVSKGGTNQWHGDAFEYLRNSAMDARNYFDADDTGNINGFGTDKSLAFPGKRLPEFRRNNYGGALGGPIKKDKLFVFGVYEGITQALGITTTKTTLPAACYVGGTIPAVIANNGCVAGSATTPITVSPVILPLARLFPVPNCTNTSSCPSFNLTYPYVQPTTENYGQIRADYTLSAADSAFARFTEDKTTQLQPGSYQFLTQPVRSNGKYTTISETHIFSPTVLNTFRFSFSRNTVYSANGPQPAALTSDLLVSPSIQLSTAGYVPNFAPGAIFGSISPGGGVTALSASLTGGHNNQDVFTWSDDVFWTKGKHAFKFGTLMNYFQDPVLAYFDIPGVATFGSLGNFFKADYSQWTGVPANSNFYRDFHESTYGYYAQDDFRVASRLTVNLGLRYEFTTVLKEQNPSIQCYLNYPLLAPSPYACTPGLDALPNARMFHNSSLNDWSPRIGFAWDPFGNGKTAVRGGIGLYYDIGNWGELMVSNSVSNPPASGTIIITNTAATPAIPFTTPFTAASTASSTVPIAPRGVQPNLGQPSLLQRSLSVSQQLPWQMALSVGYVGSQSWHLMQIRDGNPTTIGGVLSDGIPYFNCWNSTDTTSASPITTPGATYGECPSGFTSTGPKENKNIGQVQFNLTGGYAKYNALQVQLNKRISTGLEFQFNYTWSRLEDDGLSGAGSESALEQVEIPYPFSERPDWGPSSYNDTNNVRVNMIYHAPNFAHSNGVESKLVNGWWISSIIAAQSGYPITPVLSGDRALANTNGIAERPNLDASFNRGTVVEGTAAQWFNPTMFDVPIAGQLGNAGRGIIPGPGFTNVDFSLVKDTHLGLLGEAGTLQFRAEVFNLLNHANFALPVATVWAVPSGSVAAAPAGQIGSSAALVPFGTAGQISSTVGTSRQIQLALKLIF